MLLLNKTVAVGVTTATWNPSDNSSAVLSNGNLTASFASVAGWNSIRATNPQSAGKRHAECTIVALTSANAFFGLGTAAASLTTYCGASVSVGAQLYASGPSTIYDNGVPGDYAGVGIAVGHVIGIEIDFSVGVWFADLTAGTGWTGSIGSGLLNGNPAAGTGGAPVNSWRGAAALLLMASGNYDGAPKTLTLNPGSSFLGPVSTGFTAWDA